MEQFFIPTPGVVVGAVASVLLAFLLLRKAKGRPLSVPEAKGAWPLIGHIHLLHGTVPPHLVLGHMADQCGPMFSIRMGVHKALVVSSWEIAKECLTTNDKAIATRPRLVASEVMAYESAMFGLSPYGTYWRNIRRIVTTKVPSNQCLEILQHVRESEVRESVRGVYYLWKENNGQPVEMTKVFGDIILNIIFRMIAGKRYEDEKEKGVREAIREFFEIMGRFSVLDALPFLRWLDLRGQEKMMRDTARKVDRVAQGWLDAHRRRRKLEGMGKIENEDFMDIMISAIDGGRDDWLTDHDADTVIKSTCMAVVLAATDTIMASTTWALSVLLNNKDSLKKAQKELDEEIGADRQVNENDLKNLPYIQAIIKENLRLYPVAPLSLPHESMEDCTINGYQVEKGTRIFFNLMKIHRDARVWEDPDKFRPERFLTTHKDFDVRGRNFELIPFGGGRRMCPGISMALQVVGLSLASFLHGFEFATPRNEPVDMTESIGLTNHKAKPLLVLVKPRLPEHLYNIYAAPPPFSSILINKKRNEEFDSTFSV